MYDKPTTGSGRCVIDYTSEELQKAQRPICSLISKSEKALRKLKPGTWQHIMLQNNIKALYIGRALMNRESAKDDFTPEDLRAALGMFSAMISKVEKAQTKFAVGTSQHTLQRNRLNALRLAEALTQAALNKG
jgi:hypothetical protein